MLDLLISLIGNYNKPTLFILQYILDRTKDFSLEIWYNKFGGIMDKIIKDFYEKANLLNFNVTGLLLSGLNVVTLGSDSKLIGRIFELLSTDILLSICKENNWKLEETESQTVYPDFTIITDKGEKIAVDIKTTYRKYSKKGEVLKYNFTLGSYASFLRNNTKNIAYPYDQYIKHYVIGFVYDRNNDAKAGLILKIDDKNLVPPFTNVEYFMQEKYKIAGDRPGSGNTENIGTIKSNNINDFIEGNGIFKDLGNEIFEKYWRGYPKYRVSTRNYTTLKEFLIKEKGTN